MRRNTRKIRKIRLQKFMAQNGRCFYCQLPMWENDQHRAVLENMVGSKRAIWLRSTAEHLCAKRDGGKDSAENLVAACWFCNCTRHKTKAPLTPEAYSAFVRKRLSLGRWHRLVT